MKHQKNAPCWVPLHVHANVAGQLPQLDHKMFAAIYRTHHEFVWRSLRRLGIPDTALEDAVQDVFMVAARRLDDFEGASSLQTWLFAIARRVAGAHRRSLARHCRKVEAIALSGQSGSAEPLKQQDDRNLLLRLLGSLSDEARTVYLLSELEGMNAAEIGESLGVNSSTVYSRRRAARRDLRVAVDDYLREGIQASAPKLVMQRFTLSAKRV